jgi:hypothetical protein
VKLDKPFVKIRKLKALIEQHLQQLIGLTLSGTSRAANMECLKFGNLERMDQMGKAVQVGQYGLHVQCPWRISSATSIMVGSLDVYEPVEEHAAFDESFDWDKVNGNLRDRKLQALISTQELLVTNVQADNLGGFEIIFGNGIKLVAFPSASKVDEYAEFWRLLNNFDKAKGHFVVSNSTIHACRNGL